MRRSFKVHTFFHVIYRSLTSKSKDDRTFGHLHQSTDQDPSPSKIWGTYLSRESRITKDRSDRWAANADGVLTFVRHKSRHKIVLYSPSMR